MLRLAARHGVEMPLTTALAAIFSGKIRPRLAIDMLMRRDATKE